MTALYFDSLIGTVHPVIVLVNILEVVIFKILSLLGVIFELISGAFNTSAMIFANFIEIICLDIPGNSF